MIALVLLLAQPAQVPVVSVPPIITAEVGRADLQFRGRAVRLELREQIGGEDRLYLVARDGAALLDTLRIDAPSQALAILADRRLQPLWAPLLNWAGHDLSKLRDMTLGRAERAWAAGATSWPARSTAESLATEARPVLVYTAALASAGEGEKAKRVLADWIGKAAGVVQPYDISLVAIRLANLRWADNDLDGALSAFAAARALTQGDAQYAINVDINQAAVLAEAGRYADALALADRTLAAFKEEKRLSLAGSLRQFAWIRACALAGLGRTREARQAMAETRRGPEEQREFAAILPPSAEIRLRGYRCLNDREGLVRELLANAARDYPVDAWLLMLQDDWHSARNDALWQEVRRDPKVVAAYGSRLRQLPASLTPALNSWRVDAPLAGH